MVHSSSVDIRPEWVVVEQIPFTSLSKLNYQAPASEDLAFYGQLEYYDKSYDRLTPKTDKALKKTSRAFRSVTTSDDPVIRPVPVLTCMCLLGLCCIAARAARPHTWPILLQCAAAYVYFTMYPHVQNMELFVGLYHIMSCMQLLHTSI